MMKVGSLVLALVAVIATSAHADTIFEEDFESYAPGTKLVGQGGWRVADRECSKLATRQPGRVSQLVTKTLLFVAHGSHSMGMRAINRNSRPSGERGHCLASLGDHIELRDRYRQERQGVSRSFGQAPHATDRRR